MPPSITYTLSLHAALPILLWWMKRLIALRRRYRAFGRGTLDFLWPDNRKVLAFLRRYSPSPLPFSPRSEEHTSELQSRGQLVCRLLPEKKRKEAMIEHARA